MNNQKLRVTIRNKDKVLFQGDVSALSSINDTGKFDILPQHENFISLIKEKLIVHPTLKENNEIQIENGVLRAFENKVNIYVNFKS